MRRIALLILVIVLMLSACEQVQHFPEEGVWYCSELQAQFTRFPPSESLPDDYFVDNDESGVYVIVDGEKIACVWGNRRNSTRLTIVCQETNNPNYALGEAIYVFEFVSLSDSEYVLKDEYGKEYTFVRTD